MIRTKQQELEQAQDLHLIRDERDLALEEIARSRAHTGLQIGCLLLAALCYLQGDPTWTIFLALPLLGWSSSIASAAMPGTGSPSSGGWPPLRPPGSAFDSPLSEPYLGDWPTLPRPPGRLSSSGRCTHRPVWTSVRADSAGRLLAEGQVPQDGRGPMGELLSVCLYPAASALSGGNQSAGFGSHHLGQRFSVLRPWFPCPGTSGPGIPRRRRAKTVP